MRVYGHPVEELGFTHVMAYDHVLGADRTLLEEWAYARPYATETHRRQALPQWLHFPSHHRGHTALDGHPSANRAPNLSGQNN
ncbi:hypothetical protein [Herbidospora galbida]|uniref:hypothetical protein n=1 Tax=Herbidospora galbida TaxID=2575442 RepID=UPI001BB08B32